MSIFKIDPDIASAETLDTAFYTDPVHFESSKEKIFSSSWQFIGDTGLVTEKGDCYPFTLLPGYLDEPLLLTKPENGEVKCLSNVCTHRGNILVDKPCHLPQLRCRYHGRIFGLDGQFRSMPEFKEVKNFPRPEDHLQGPASFEWGNLLFVNLEKDKEAKWYFGEMMERLSWLPLHEFKPRPELSSEYEVNAHWALYCENYLEGFHIPFVHAGLNAVIDYGNYTTEIYRGSNLQLGIAKEGETCFDLPETSPDFGKNVAAYYYWVYPNMMFNFYPWGLSVNLVKPISINRTKVQFMTYVWKEELFNTGAGSDLNTVEMEDEEVVEAVQKGIRSRYYKHGRYSVSREQGTHHFHQLIAKSMG